MSLTSFLESQAHVRAELLRLFPRPAAARPKLLLVPPLTTNYALVGTAFDYALRWYIECNSSARVVERGRWVAYQGVDKLPRSLRAVGRSMIVRARHRLRASIEAQDVQLELLESALELAKLDTVFRSGFVDPRIADPVNPTDVHDLRALLDLVPRALDMNRQRCILNPTFNSSSLVGGADADLVLGDMLLEVKVTKDPKIPRDHFNQLIGYMLLFQHSGLSGLKHQPRISKLGVYMARFGALVSWNLREIAPRATFAAACEWFAQQAIAWQAGDVG